jgi:ABC-2 type transport system permease protein
MAATTATLRHSDLARPKQRILAIYINEAKFEFLKNLRLRTYSISTIAFPLMFYVLFGLILGRQSVGSISMPRYLIPSYGTFGVIGASLFGTAAGLAAERGLGWLQVKRASPMPPLAYFAGKIAMSMIFSGVVVVLLLALGIGFGGVQLSVLDIAKLVTTLVAGSLPFCAMGLAIGYFVGPNSAPAVINMIYLPLSFCSGLWVPLMFLPHFMQQLAKFLPPYHLAQLALGIVGAGRQEASWIQWSYLAGFTVICLAVARFGMRRDEGKLYG